MNDEGKWREGGRKKRKKNKKRSSRHDGEERDKKEMEGQKDRVYRKVEKEEKQEGKSRRVIVSPRSLSRATLSTFLPPSSTPHPFRPFLSLLHLLLPFRIKITLLHGWSNLRANVHRAHLSLPPGAAAGDGVDVFTRQGFCFRFNAHIHRVFNLN